MKMIKKILSVLMKILLVLLAAASLFFGIAVLGKRLWATTQISTVFYTLALPFLILFLIILLIIDAFVLWRKKGKGWFFRINLAAGAAALAIFCVETGIFKVAASAGGGKFSLLRGLTMKDVEMSTPDESVVYANHDGQDLTISIYKPKEQSENLQPVYVYMHGGGWSSNNSETNSNIHRQMADAGFIGFSINYRLCTSGSTDNPTWDKAIYDCAEAMNWIKEHAAEYGGDASRIFLAGESAGGNLVLQYAGMTSEGKLDAPVPNAVLAMYPVVDLQWTSDYGHFLGFATPGICEAYIGGELSDYPDRVKFVSPLTYMNEDLPPILILHGTKDTLVSVEGSEEYKKEADAIGADVSLIELPFSNHGTDQQVNRTATLNWLKNYEGMLPDDE